MKKLYNMSVANITAEERKILVSNSGKQYDVSFRPALVDRELYKAWVNHQSKIISMMNKFYDIKARMEKGVVVGKEDQAYVEEFYDTTSEAAEVGTALVVYVIKQNGYPDMSEDELYANFSEQGIAEAINFIMDISSKKEDKKTNKKKS